MFDATASFPKQSLQVAARKIGAATVGRKALADARGLFDVPLRHEESDWAILEAAQSSPLPQPIEAKEEVASASKHRTAPCLVLLFVNTMTY